MPKYRKLSIVLAKAADFLNKHHLAKDYYAKDREGQHTLLDDPSAVAFCAFGAIARVMRLDTGGIVIESLPGKFLTRYTVDRFNLGVTSFNDSPYRSKDEVVNLLRQASQQARQEGK